MLYIDPIDIEFDTPSHNNTSLAVDYYTYNPQAGLINRNILIPPFNFLLHSSCLYHLADFFVLIQLRLCVPQPAIATLLVLIQLRMVAALHEPALVQHQNFIAEAAG